MGKGDRLDVTPSRRNSARQRKALWIGFGLSAAIHLLLLFGWRTPQPDVPGSLAAGPRAGDHRAAAGGGAMVALSITPPRPIEVPAPPADQPQMREPEVDLKPERLILAASFSGPSGGTPGERVGSGLTGATGEGDAGNDRSGDDRNSPPTPRSITPRWDPPKDLRGQRVTFRVQVDVRGEPTGEIEVHPEIADSEFARQVRRDLLGMDFVPARRDGRPITDWAELTLVF